MPTVSVTIQGLSPLLATQGGSGNLYADPWFDVGLFLGGLGLLVGILAVASSAAHVASRSAFPDVKIRIVGQAGERKDRPVPFRPGTVTAMEVVRLTLHIVNDEPSRNVSLSFSLRYLSATDPIVLHFSASSVDQNEARGLGLGFGNPSLLEHPVHLSPKGSTSGDIYFEEPFSPEDFDWSKITTRTIHVSDNISETTRSYVLQLGALTKRVTEE